MDAKAWPCGCAGETNSATWCGEPVCNADNEQVLRDAWVRLAEGYCGYKNVILADIFNEPHGALWDEWRAAVTRIANAILSKCPRWLVAVQGVGQGSGECQARSGEACWWGENVLGHLQSPITLSIPDRLVLVPHTYGHGSQSYMSDPAFPKNMPSHWDSLWGHIPEETGTPVIIGEWGGLFRGKSEQWQRSLQQYMRERRM